MKKVCLYYFSGTGMTEYVVSKIVAAFKNQAIEIHCLKIEATNPSEVSLKAYDQIGFAYPVHAFNAPKLVIKFIDQLPQGKQKQTFILSTAGEDTLINDGSSRHLIKKLTKKGYHVFYDKQFSMPSNFSIKHTDDEVQKRLAKVAQQAHTVANHIHLEKNHLKKMDFMAKAFAVIGRAEWFGAPFMGKFFYANDTCTQCGICIKRCPNKNIEMKKKGIGFKWHCGLCLRCIYKCPNEAISIHHPFKFIVLDSWYDFENKG